VFTFKTRATCPASLFFFFKSATGNAPQPNTDRET